MSPDPKPKRRRKKKGPRYAQNIADFRPGLDHVVRLDDGSAVVRDTQGFYADAPVDGDVMGPEFVVNVTALSPERRAKMFYCVRDTPFLSREGREERLRVLMPMIPWRFVVESPPHQLDSPVGDETVSDSVSDTVSTESLPDWFTASP